MTSHNREHATIDSFHDCYVVGIETDPADTQARVTLYCPQCTGRAVIILEGLFRLKLDDYRQGNIVLSIQQYSWQEAPVELVARAVGLDPAAEKRLLPVLRKVEEDRLTLFSLDPSYGCTITALCKSISVCAAEDDGPPPS